MGPTLTFRTAFSRAIAIIIPTLAVAAVIAFGIQGGLREVVRSAPGAVLAGVMGWALFWRPYVEVADGGITIVNIVRTIHVPWPTFERAESQWSLRIFTSAGAFTAWAVPASSGSGARLQPNRSQNTADDPRGLARFGNAEAAALAIGERVKALTAAGYLKRRAPAEIRPTVTYSRAVIAALAGSAAATVATLVV